jgi:transcriptional regulator with XRE-family HTH domain
MGEKQKILRVKELMKEKGISREQMATRLSMTTASISNITSEKTNPPLELLLAISEVLNVDIRELFVSTKGKTNESSISEAKLLIQKGLDLLK